MRDDPSGASNLTREGGSGAVASLLSGLGREAFTGYPLSKRAQSQLAALDMFSDADYFAMYPDVERAGMQAWEHAVLHASGEGRPIALKSALARAYGDAALALANPKPTGVEEPWGPAEPDAPGRLCTILVHSRSTSSIEAAALDLALGLRAEGFSCRMADETADYCEDLGLPIFVAPHEFFFRGAGPLWLSAEIVGTGFLYNTEPISRSLRTPVLAALLNARGLLETSAASDQVWQAAGIPSLLVERRIKVRDAWLHEQDLDHPLILGAPAMARRLFNDPLAWRSRSIDVLCFDTFSERRSRFFGLHAAALSRQQCYIYLRQGAPRHLEIAADDDARARIAGHLAAHAKITLSLSEDGLPESDSFRVFDQTFAAGSVLVSDRTVLDRRCEPGRNYFQEERKHIPQLIDWLLNDKDGVERAEATQRQAFETIRSINSNTAAARRLARFIRTP